MIYKPTIEQEIIYNEIKDIVASPKCGRNLMLEADAGTGKSSTIQESTRLIPDNVLYLAYNTHIADDYRPKALPNTEVRTTHSHGFKAILSTIKYGQGKEVTLDEYKVYDLVKHMLLTQYLEVGEENTKLLQSIVPKIVSYLKSTLMQMSEESIEFLSDKYQLEDYYILLENNIGKLYEKSDGTKYAIDLSLVTKMCTKIMQICFRAFLPNESCSIDYDDQFWLPIVRPDIRIKKYPWVIVDEAQDLNPAQMKLVMMSVTPNGTIIVVGDPHQSIYAFRGADSQAMPKMKQQLKAKVLTLSVCFRCPTEHVRLAQEYVPNIKPFENNKAGVVKHINDTIMYNTLVNMLPNKDPVYVLCRNNYPLVKPCFELIRNGINATIRGREIGKNLISRIRNTKGTEIEEFKKNLKEWMNKKKSSLEQGNKSIELLVDTYETIIALSLDCNNTDELIAKIDRIFSDKNSAIVFSTVHKVKGFESDKVLILYPELMPSPFAKTEEAMEQENNVQYITVTRSKDTLIFVHKLKE
jgi:superfamily I DNA/RNA helicase